MIDEGLIRPEDFEAIVGRARQQIETAAADARALPKLQAGTAEEMLRRLRVYAEA